MSCFQNRSNGIETQFFLTIQKRHVPMFPVTVCSLHNLTNATHCISIRKTRHFELKMQASTCKFFVELEIGTPGTCNQNVKKKKKKALKHKCIREVNPIDSIIPISISSVDFIFIPAPHPFPADPLSFQL